MAAHCAWPARRGRRGRPVGARVVDPGCPPWPRTHPGAARDPHRRHGDPSVGTGRSRDAPRPAAAPSSDTGLSRSRTRRGRAVHAWSRRHKGCGRLTNTGPTTRSARQTQPERTTLAWTRTSLAVLANGAILLLRDTHTGGGRLHVVAAGVAAVLALATYLIGVRRQRLLSHRPLPDHISPRLEVYLTGGSVIALILISGFSVAV